MSHGITDKDGLVLYKNPAWHGLGTVLQEDISPKQALIEASLEWPVEMAKSPVVLDSTGRECTSNKHQACVRMDTGDILGMHGLRYQPMQNSQLFDIAYAMGDQVKVESAGSTDGGRKLFILLRGDTLNLKGNDQSIPYLALTNSHDGSTRCSAVPTTVRVVCENTLSLMFQKAGQRMYAITHQGSIDNKIESMKKNIVRFQQDTQTWLDDVTQLQSKTLSHTETVSFWGDIYSRLWGKPVTEEEMDKAASTLGKWESTLETERVSLSYGDVDVWLAANAISDDIQHSDPVRVRENWQARRMDSNWFGETAKKTASVFQAALGAL